MRVKASQSVSNTRPQRGAVIIITIVLAIVAFAASPNGPLGGFWRPAAGGATPAGIQLLLFMLVNLGEVITFGLGVSFLIFGYRFVRDALPQSPSLAAVTYLALGWSLVSWWPHDSLHQHIGENIGGLLALELGFHLTLMAAGLLLACTFITLARQRS